MINFSIPIQLNDPNLLQYLTATHSHIRSEHHIQLKFIRISGTEKAEGKILTLTLDLNAPLD